MSMFDGLTGWIAATAMEKMNAAAEGEAVERLSPQVGSSILVIGHGPGLGLEYLLKHPVARVVGVDPSSVMHRAARRRNKSAIRDGRLELQQIAVENLDLESGKFDGAVAVHTLQICRPFGPTARRLAHVMRAGSRLVSITHSWAAMKDYGSAEIFVNTISASLREAGFAEVSDGYAHAENGKAILLEAVR